MPGFSPLLDIKGPITEAGTLAAAKKMHKVADVIRPTEGVASYPPDDFFKITTCRTSGSPRDIEARVQAHADGTTKVEYSDGSTANVDLDGTVNAFADAGGKNVSVTPNQATAIQNDANSVGEIASEAAKQDLAGRKSHPLAYYRGF